MAVRVNRAFCHFWASQTVENSSRATCFFFKISPRTLIRFLPLYPSLPTLVNGSLNTIRLRSTNKFPPRLPSRYEKIHQTFVVLCLIIKLHRPKHSAIYFCVSIGVLFP